MRAFHVPAAGRQPELSDLPAPVVTVDTVLIRVKAAGLNPFDNAVATGMMAERMPHEYPVVLGRDAAGVATAVGDGVAHIRVGDEVFGHVLLAPPIQAGTLADYALLPAAGVARKPAGLDFTVAAAIPLAGAAASAAVDAIDPQTGDTVLVNGASGGVGSYAIQLLAARGVTVVATGTGDDVDRLRSLGAATVVDHTAGPLGEQVRAVHPKGVDALVNLAGFTAAEVPLDAVRKGGNVATTTGAPDDDALSSAELSGSTVIARPTREVIARLAEQAVSGALRVDVQAVLPLEKASDGLATLAAGNARGKIVISVGD